MVTEPNRLSRQVVAHVASELEKMDREDPTQADATDMVWHFTTTSGLLGIFETKSLFATNLGYMNDWSEITTGRTHVAQLLFEGKKAIGVEAGTIATLRSSHMRKWESPNLQEYAVCFCLFNNQLSQWRGYGGGVAIGFDRQKLDRLRTRGLSLNKMWYLNVENEDLKKFSADVVIARTFQRYSEGPVRNDLRNGDVSLWTTILDGVQELLAPRCKHGGFAEEHEWRLIYRKPNTRGLPTDFRIRGNSLVPFVRIGGKRGVLELIKWVTIGPMSRMDEFLTMKALEMTKERYGVSFQISRSGIPYRTYS